MVPQVQLSNKYGLGCLLKQEMFSVSPTANSTVGRGLIAQAVYVCSYLPPVKRFPCLKKSKTGFMVRFPDCYLRQRNLITLGPLITQLPPVNSLCSTTLLEVFVVFVESAVSTTVNVRNPNVRILAFWKIVRFPNG